MTGNKGEYSIANFLFTGRYQRSWNYIFKFVNLKNELNFNKHFLYNCKMLTMVLCYGSVVFIVRQ